MENNDMANSEDVEQLILLCKSLLKLSDKSFKARRT